MHTYELAQPFPDFSDHPNDSIVGLIEVVNRQFPKFIDVMVDGGAGIGHIINLVLTKHPELNVIAYEPLPENARVLRAKFREQSNVDIREVALGNRSGTCRFEVPTISRKGIDNSPWIPGTSAEGAVRRYGLVKTSKLIVKKVIRWDPRPSIEVKINRLESDLQVAPDLLKLDLQGGEPEAIEGLGHFLAETKVVKLEHELFGKWGRTHSIDMLRDAGFSLYVDDFLIVVPQMTDYFRATLAELGLEITYELRLYGPRSPYLHVVGKWPNGGLLPIHSNIKLTRQFADLLTAQKANAFQVDIMALNNRYAEQWASILPAKLLRQSGMLSA